MLHYSLFVFLLVATSCVRVYSQDREYVHILDISNPYDAGDWGVVDMCPDGSFVRSADVQYHIPNNLDETAINTIRFYCTDEDGFIYGTATSTLGNQGEYQPIRSCSEGVITGIRVKVLEYQGLFTDDVAIQDVEVSCDYGKELLPLLPADVLASVEALQAANKLALGGELAEVKPFAYNEGDWSEWSECNAGTAFCGIQVRHEFYSLGDEVATTDGRFYCCQRYYSDI